MSEFILSPPAVTRVILETDKPQLACDNLSAGYGRLPDAALPEKMARYFRQF